MVFFWSRSFVGEDFEEFVKNLRSCLKKFIKLSQIHREAEAAEIFLLGYEFLSAVKLTSFNFLLVIIIDVLQLFIF